MLLVFVALVAAEGDNSKEFGQFINYTCILFDLLLPEHEKVLAKGKCGIHINSLCA